MAKRLTEAEIRNYKLSEEEVQLVNKFKLMMKGELVDDAPRLNEFLATPSATVLLPKVILGTVREAAEPVYLASRFFKKIRMKQSGSTVIFPSFGVMRAQDVAEGMEIPEDTIDWQQHSASSEVRVNKYGLRVRVTQELIDENQFDIISMLLEQAGRAIARHQEQKAFVALMQHGKTLFDNKLRASNPEAGTNGLDKDGTLNDTLAIEDLLEIIIAMMANEMTPTDLIMHPIIWSVFMKNELMANAALNPHTWVVGGTKPETPKLGPESIQGRLPFAFNVNLSPFAPVNRFDKTYDLICVDRNNVGIHLIKQDVTTEQFDEPARDLRNIKLVGRSGYGVLHEGRGIVLAKNISMAKSYGEPMVVRNIGN